MKKIFLIIAIFFQHIGNCTEFEVGRVFVNPGFKLGYVFGESGGFIYGVELSVVYLPTKGGRYGIVYDYDIFGDYSKHHFGVEYFPNLYSGIDVGPTIVSGNDTSKYGLSVIPFIGVGELLYYNYTYINSQTNFNEVGLYSKLFFGNYKFTHTNDW